MRKQIRRKRTNAERKLRYKKFSQTKNSAKDSQKPLRFENISKVSPKSIEFESTIPLNEVDKTLPGLGDTVARVNFIQLLNDNVDDIKVYRNLLTLIDVNEADENGVTLLMRVAYNRDFPKLIKLLISKGADINAIDKNGNTALIVAAISHNVENANMLLKYNADINIKNNEGKDYNFYKLTIFDTDAALLSKMEKMARAVSYVYLVRCYNAYINDRPLKFDEKDFKKEYQALGLNPDKIPVNIIDRAKSCNKQELEKLVSATLSLVLDLFPTLVKKETVSHFFNYFKYIGEKMHYDLAQTVLVQYLLLHDLPISLDLPQEQIDRILKRCTEFPVKNLEHCIPNIMRQLQNEVKNQDRTEFLKKRLEDLIAGKDCYHKHYFLDFNFMV